MVNNYRDKSWVGYVNPKTGVKVIEICEGARRKIVNGREKSACVQWICWCPVCEKLFDKPVDAIDVYSGKRESCGCKRYKKLYDEKLWSGYKNENTGIAFVSVVPERITNKAWWNCRCFCGNEFKAPASNIVNGHTKSCGCLKSSYKNMSKWCGYVNDYGVKVLSVSDKTDDDGDTFWNCECSCGNIITRKAYKVVSGDIKTCGCLEIFDSPDKNNYNNPKWDGYVFPNGITVLKRMKKGGTIKWLCKCHCGNEWEVQADLIVKGKQKSCGCELSISKGHKQIQELLVSNNVLFELEKTFTDLYSLKNRPLRFDFSIENNNGDLLALIEYDGEQHHDFTVFKRLSRGHATYEDFLEAQERDKQKDDYVREHNIPMYRIPYTYTPEQIEARVLEILKELNLI